VKELPHGNVVEPSRIDRPSCDPIVPKQQLAGPEKGAGHVHSWRRQARLFGISRSLPSD
jgi:hypothetical protein